MLGAFSGSGPSLPPALCPQMEEAWSLGGSEGSHPSPLPAGPSTGVGKPTWGGGGWEVASPGPQADRSPAVKGVPGARVRCCDVCDRGPLGSREGGAGAVKSPIWKPCYCPEAALWPLLPRDHKLAGELAGLRGELRIPAWPVAPPPPSRPAPPPPRASPAGNHLSSPSPRWSYRIAWEQGERRGERGEKREGHPAAYFSTPREAAVQPLAIGFAGGQGQPGRCS